MIWDKNIFLENIHRLINEFCGGTKAEFNRRIGSQRDAASRWDDKNPDSKPSLGAVIKICNEFNCSIDWLLTGKKNTPNPDEEPLIDIELLKRIIARVETNLTRKRQELDPEKKAELISLLYEYFTKTSGEVGAEIVERFLRLVA